MKKLCIWLCIISGLISWETLQAQEVEVLSQDTLSIKKKFRKHPMTLRAGLDLYRPIRTQIDDEYSSFELVTDLNITDNLYIALEAGTEERTMQSEQVNFDVKGNYIKIGIDYNMFENWEGMDNQVYIGFRIAGSSHELNINNYLLYTTNHFFDDAITSIGYATGPRPDLSANWFEIVTGIKVELTNNLYTGFSLRLNVLMGETVPENFANLFIPGFNKVTDDNNFSVGFNYTLTYALRFGKKDKELQTN